MKWKYKMGCFNKTNKKHKIHNSAAFWHPKIKTWKKSPPLDLFRQRHKFGGGWKRKGVLTLFLTSPSTALPALVSNTVVSWPNLETQYRFFSNPLKTIAQICRIHKRQTCNRIIYSYKNSASSKWSFNNGNTLLFHINCTQTQKHFWNLLLAPRL